MLSIRKALYLLTGILLLVGVAATFVATEQARIAAVNMENFPNAEAWVTAWDASGKFIGGLGTKDVAVKEDGKPRKVLSFAEAQPGVQAVIAVQPGRAFNIHDNQGVSRYQYIFNQVVSWLDSHPKGNYDLSLYTTDGVSLSHVTDLKKFRSAWMNYKPKTDVDYDQIGIQALTEGIKLATTPAANPAMGKALLWITPLPAVKTVKNLNSYLQQAHQFGIHVYIWLVAPADAAKTPEVKQLSKFAQATGGRLTLFSGVEVLPTLGQLWGEVNHAYRLIYQSAAIKGEKHSLEVTLHTKDGKTIKTPPFTFKFALQPPRISISGLPERVVRRTAGTATAPAKGFAPSLAVHFSVDFPDKHPRALKQISLLVDGKPVAQCNSPRCNTLQWDLSAYSRTAPHTVVVKAVDEFGIAGTSAPKTVQIVVERAERGVHAQVASHRNELVIGTVLLSGLVLAVVLALGVVKARKRKTASGLSLSGSPRPSARLWYIPRLPRRRRARAESAESQPLAYFVPLKPDEEAGLPPLIPINSPECTIGSDPAQATIVVKHPSVSPTHARLWRSGEGAFYIADRRSDAGTWVNYAPVSSEGTLLQPGDLVHIGKVGFRFRLQPEEKTEVLVKTL